MPKTGSVRGKDKALNVFDSSGIAQYSDPSGPSRTFPKASKIKAKPVNVFKRTERPKKKKP